MSSAFTRNPQLLSSPSDLWIVPPPAASTWFPRIDWYLNWQLTKGLEHKRHRPPLELLRIMEEWGIPYLEGPQLQSPPLMAISDGRIPCSKCVVIDNPLDLADWLTRASDLITGLGAQKIHVFLPEGAMEVQARELWKSVAPRVTASVEFLPNDVPSPDEGPTAW